MKRNKVSLATKIWWSIFGKPEAIIMEEEASEYGVPYRDREFWPAFRCFDKTDVSPGVRHHIISTMICPKLYASKVGDIVPVFEGVGKLFMYRVNGFSWASGSDHIVSPRKFDITFVGTKDAEQ